MEKLDLDSPSYSPSELEGEITSTHVVGGGPGGTESQLDTLDEPVYDTLMRDLKAVGSKFLHALYPRQSQVLLRDWDLWGPLFLCVFIALVIHSGSDSKEAQFTEVFVITWFGACVVTLNIKLLGGNISYFQSLCVLGYCLLAPAVALVVCKILVTVAEQTTVLFIVRLVITTFGFIWATYASTAFLATSQPPRRKALSIYPIFLFYFVVSWLIVSQTHYGH